MSDTKSAPDLSVFENDYDIIGELDSPDESRVFIASRRTSDDMDYNRKASSAPRRTRNYACHSCNLWLMLNRRWNAGDRCRTPCPRAP